MTCALLCTVKCFSWSSMSAYRTLWEIFPARRLIMCIQCSLHFFETFFLNCLKWDWLLRQIPCNSCYTLGPSFAALLILGRFSKSFGYCGLPRWICAWSAASAWSAAAPDLAAVVGCNFAASEGWWTHRCPYKFVVCLSFTHFLHIVQIGFVGSLGSPFTSGKKTKICPNSRFNVLFWHWIAVGHFVFCFLADVTAPSLSS